MSKLNKADPNSATPVGTASRPLPSRWELERDGIPTTEASTVGRGEDPAEFFARRLARIDHATVDQFFNNRTGGEPPRPGDELPEGYQHPTKAAS